MKNRKNTAQRLLLALFLIESAWIQGLKSNSVSIADFQKKRTALKTAMNACCSNAGSGGKWSKDYPLVDLISAKYINMFPYLSLIHI